jgi:glutamate/tyrosine decarboxylase-like PLP-dependent enzyme
MAQGMVLFKDVASLDTLRHNANYILRSHSGDLGQTSLEGSRRFDALKLWASFKIFGASGYATLLAQAASVTDAMRALLREQDDFALTSDSSTFILTYRFVPRHLREALAQRLDAGDLPGAAALNRQLNALNVRLQERQKANGKSFVSRTLLESRACPEGIAVLRAVLSNVTTTPAHLQAIVAEQRELGRAIARELGLETEGGPAA